MYIVTYFTAVIIGPLTVNGPVFIERMKLLIGVAT